MSLSALKDNFNLTTAYAVVVSIAFACAGCYIYQSNPIELQHKLDVANAERLSAKDEAKKAIAEAEIAKSKNKTLESQLDKCQAELQSALKECSPDKQDIKKLQDENLLLKGELEVTKKEVSNKSAELTAAIENLNKTIENLNNEIKVKNAEISILSNPDRSLFDALNNIPGFQNLPVKVQNEYRQDILKLKSKIQKYIGKKGF